MKIWVDADACPLEARYILRRAARRLSLPLVWVANHDLGEPTTDLVQTLLVPHGADQADQAIAAQVEAGDLVITADIPLAAEVVAKGAHVMDTRGDELTEDDVRSRLAQRNFMEDLRSAGIQTGGPSAYGDVDKQRFAAALDRHLTRRVRQLRRPR